MSRIRPVTHGAATACFAFLLAQSSGRLSGSRELGRYTAAAGTADKGASRAASRGSFSKLMLQWQTLGDSVLRVFFA